MYELYCPFLTIKYQEKKQASLIVVSVVSILGLDTVSTQ